MKEEQHERDGYHVLLRILGMSLVIIVSFLVLSLPNTINEVSGEENNEWYVMVLTEQQTFDSGENANIEIRTFRNAEPWDVDEITINFTDVENRTWDFEVNVTTSRYLPGIYRVDFSVPEIEQENWSESIHAVVNCIPDSEDPQTIVSHDFFLYLQKPNIELTVSTDTPYFSAGETVRFNVEVRKDGLFSDVGISSAQLWMNESWTDVTLEQDGTGLYHYDHLSSEGAIGQEIRFQVVVLEDNINFTDSAFALLQYYQIWFHTLQDGGDTVEGEFGVSDINGSPVQASLDVRYAYYDDEALIEKTWTGTTDGEGLIQITFETNGMNKTRREIDFLLWTNGTGGRGEDHTQYLHEKIDLLDDVHNGGGSGFQVGSLIENPYFSGLPEFNALPSASDVVIDLRALFDESPIQNGSLEYYVYTHPEAPALGADLTGDRGVLIGFGVVTTDQEGNFTLDFHTPDDITVLLISYRWNASDGGRAGEMWTATSNTFIIGTFVEIDQTINMSNPSNFFLGDVATLQLSAPEFLGTHGKLSVQPLPYSTSNEELQNIILGQSFPEWIFLNDLSIESEHILSLDPTIFNITLPSFFPTDSNYAIIASFFSDESGEIHTETKNYLVVDTTGSILADGNQLTISTTIPDEVTSESAKPITITVSHLLTLPGVDVTLETAGPVRTCKSHDITDSEGRVHCSIFMEVVTTDESNFTIWINATKNGYVESSFMKIVHVTKYVPPKNLIITSDLPDVVDSSELRPMLITVTVDGEPEPDASVTLQVAGSGKSCKSAAFTDELGEVHCYLTVDNVSGEDSQVTLWFNASKDGHTSFFYTKVVVVRAWNAPDVTIGPIVQDLGNGSKVTVLASVVGLIDIEVALAEQPDSNDSYNIGLYSNISASGTGTFRWINITFTYSDLPSEIEAEKLRIYTWSEGRRSWSLEENTNVDVEKKIVWVNLTHLSIFAPRQLDDVDPPVIDHKPISRSSPGEDITISATVIDEGRGITFVTLFYRNADDSLFSIESMVPQGDVYSAVIPDYKIKGEAIEYYIRASDGTNTATHPAEKNELHTIEIREKSDDGGFLPGYEMSAVIAMIIGAILLIQRRRMV